MKTKFLVVPFCAALAFTSCQKEKLVPLGGKNSSTSNSSSAAHRTDLLSHSDLVEFMPEGPDVTPTEYKRSNADETINEYTRSYAISSSNVLNVSVADFVNDKTAISEFLVGRGIIMSTATDAVSGIMVNLLSDKVATDCNMMLAQSTNRGAIDFALASDAWTSLVQESNGLNLATSAPSNFTYAEGSSITAFADKYHPDVTGWVIYDSKTLTSMAILVVPDATGDRMGYLIEEAGASESTDKVLSIADGIPYDKIAEL